MLYAKVCIRPEPSTQLDRELERKIGENVEPIDAVIVLRDGERDESVLERQQAARVERVLRPTDARCAIGVELVDEVDEVVRHVAAAVYIQDVRPMRGPEDWKCLEPLADCGMRQSVSL